MSFPPVAAEVAKATKSNQADVIKALAVVYGSACRTKAAA